MDYEGKSPNNSEEEVKKDCFEVCGFTMAVKLEVMVLITILINLRNHARIFLCDAPFGIPSPPRCQRSVVASFNDIQAVLFGIHRTPVGFNTWSGRERLWANNNSVQRVKWRIPKYLAQSGVKQ